MGPFCVSEIFWYRKNFMDRRVVGYHVFPSKDFVSLSTEKFPRRTLVIQKCYGVEFFFIIGVPRFCRFFSSHTAEKVRRGALLCFRMFRVSKNLKTERGISRLCIEKNLSHSAEKIRRRTFLCLTKFLLSKKFIDKRGEWGSITILCLNFMSQCQQISYGNPLVCHYFRVSKNFLLKRIMSRFSVKNLLSHSSEKFRRGILYCFTNFGYRKCLG